MPKITNLKQRSPEWHRWREGKITASQIATIMGLNPKKSPLMLYNQIQNGGEDQVNESMERGTRLEPLARAWAEDYLSSAYPEACMEHEEYPWLAASLDGWNECARVKLIEIKCPGAANHQQAKLGVVPSQWYPQCQMQMYIADVDEMYFISYVSDDDVESVLLKKDDRFIKKMMEAVFEFRSCLTNYLEPDPMDMDLLNVDAPEAIAFASELCRIQSDIKALEDRDKQLRAHLKMLCEGKSALIGGQYRFKKSMARGAIDYSVIPELTNVDLEKYRKKPFEKWRFT